VWKLKPADWLESFEAAVRVETISTTCGLQAFAEEHELRVATNFTFAATGATERGVGAIVLDDADWSDTPKRSRTFFTILSIPQACAALLALNSCDTASKPLLTLTLDY
jgi:hypothetical protein